MGKKPISVEVKLDLGDFTFKPAKRREDGGLKSRPEMVLKMLHRDAPVRALMTFLENASGHLKIKIEATDIVPESEPWEGFGEIHSVKWKHPGPRAEEQGKEEHPVVEIPLSILSGSATDLHSLMGLRLNMDEAGLFEAQVSLQVWQEDLPFESEEENRTEGRADRAGERVLRRDLRSLD